MNRVTRISSAAFGMLLLAGLAYYQGNGDPTAGQAGALVGTAVKSKTENRDIDCKNTADLDQEDRDYCNARKHSDKSNLN